MPHAVRQKNFCKECGEPSYYHIFTWIEGSTSYLLPSWLLYFLPKRFEEWIDILMEKISLWSGLSSLRDDFTISDIQLRSSCFINEAKKYGIKFKVLRGPFGYTNHFQMFIPLKRQSPTAPIREKKFRFEGLPAANFLSKIRNQILDDKQATKKKLKEGNFPIAEGKSFWFFQKSKACRYGAGQLGFPLVVKPRGGSIARHVTTDIKDIKQLKLAINKAIEYSPAFIIERFIPNAFVWRATVIDFNFVACVKQIPANIVGDGVSTIKQLIDKKNNLPQRGRLNQKEFILQKIVENEVTRDLLQARGYSLDSIPPRNQIVYLQKDSFLRLGGDLIEVTSTVHPHNLQLFREVAKYFDVRLVGIDFLAQDISRSWKAQTCAILELNNAPCIEMHSFPSAGKPQNIARPLVNMVLKYYTKRQK